MITDRIKDFESELYKMAEINGLNLVDFEKYPEKPKGTQKEILSEASRGSKVVEISTLFGLLECAEFHFRQYENDCDGVDVFKINGVVYLARIDYSKSSKDGLYMILSTPNKKDSHL